MTNHHIKKRPTITLMYHDVAANGEHEASGFSWPDAALYKLEPAQFDRHLQAIANAVSQKPALIFDPAAEIQQQTRLLLTFDDGGVSAYTYIANQLEARGWRGHFFIAVGYIGERSFMNRNQIRELHRRGHVIGSHSYSHPLRMARCGWDELVREWRMSVDILSEILGEPVVVASVPGGHYARRVAEAASLAGIRFLFNSEPTTRRHTVEGTQVLGRYGIQRWTSPRTAATIAAGEITPRLRQSILWNTKKVIKTLGGQYYLDLRRSLSDRGAARG